MNISTNNDLAQATALEQKEPLAEISINGCTVTLLGTAHVSRASAAMVRELLDSNSYDAVAVELCPSRFNAIINPDLLAKMNLFEVIRNGKAPMVAANLALGAYQQRMAEQLGIEPGADMRAAIESAKDKRLPILMIDRDIGITLKRIYKNVPWWRRFGLVAGLLASVLSRQKVSEKEIEQLKEGDMLETAFSQFAEEAEDLFTPLITERDQYMGLRLQVETAKSNYRRVLAVVGAGHLKGIHQHLADAQSLSPDSLNISISELEQIPKSTPWIKIIPWIIVILILFGFGIGFSRSSDLGWQLVVDWIIINGGLAALGATIAAAHPVTIVTAFLAAPLTSLNPMIGAGMVTSAVEVLMRKPNVGDFGQLRHATASIKGWWKNRVARTLLVFLFSTLGSAAGTYLAGFRIFERLSN